MCVCVCEGKGCVWRENNANDAHVFPSLPQFIGTFPDVQEMEDFGELDAKLTE